MSQTKSSHSICDGEALNKQSYILKMQMSCKWELLTWTEKTLGIMKSLYWLVSLKIFDWLFDILLCTFSQAIGLGIG